MTFSVIQLTIHLKKNSKRTNEYERIVVTPSCPAVAMRSDQLNDENEDFASRRRYHQSSVVHGRYVDDV